MRLRHFMTFFTRRGMAPSIGKRDVALTTPGTHHPSSIGGGFVVRAVCPLADDADLQLGRDRAM